MSKVTLYPSAAITSSGPGSRDVSRALIGPGITRAVLRERDRAPLDGTLPGDGYRLMVEAFVERGTRARIETWRLDIRRVPTDTSEDEWRVAGQLPLSSVDGLYRLSLNTAKAWRARNLVVRSDDLEIRIPDGQVFVADTNEGPTAAVGPSPVSATKTQPSGSRISRSTDRTTRPRAR